MTDTGSGPFYDGTPGVNIATWDNLAWGSTYPDLTLKQPTCPNCGSRATLMIAPFLHPSAWCANDDCPSITWDPSKSAVDVLWHLLTQPGRSELRPETAPG